MSSGASRPGLTLAEVMIAVALALLIAVLGAQGVRQMKRIVDRSRAQAALAADASRLASRLQNDLGSIMHHGALWLVRDAGGIELVLLHGRDDFLPFSQVMINDLNAPQYTRLGGDLAWYRLRWEQSAGTLTLAESSWMRLATVTTAYTAPAPNWLGAAQAYAGKSLALLAEPRRVAALPLAATLDGNAWGTGSPDDYGDYQDLRRQAITVASNLEDLAIELVLGDGTKTQVEKATSAGTWTWDGLRTDAAGANATPRPVLARIRFLLADPRLGLRRSYTFSIPLAPILQPGP